MTSPTYSNGTRTRIAYTAETSFGVIPGSPTMTGLNFNSSNFALTKQIQTDDSITGDRMVRHTGHGNTVSSGDIVANLTYGDTDVFLEALLSGTFSSDVLKPGATQKSFTIEEASLDIAQYRVFSGSLVNKLALTVANTGYVAGTWSFMSQNHSISASALAGSVTASSGLEPYFEGTAVFSEGGSPSDIISSISLSIDNGLTAQYALGNTAPIGFSPGFITVTGSLTAYFSDAALYNKFVNATNSSLDVILQDSARNQIEINLPNIQYSAATKSISGTGPAPLTMPFTARYDSGSSAHIVVTRTPV